MAQKNNAFVMLQTQKRMYQRHLIVFMATEVVCPIIVLKAKLVMVAIETPFARVLVSKISAGTKVGDTKLATNLY